MMAGKLILTRCGMALTAHDRALLDRCLSRQPGSWNDFVDRFIGLVYHSIRHTAYLRGSTIAAVDVEDIAQEVMLEFLADDYKVLRRFAGQSSLAVYLTVVARRTAARELARRHAARQPIPAEMRPSGHGFDELNPAEQVGLEKLEEVHRLLKKLPPGERAIVRLFYLEGRSYEEISSELEVSVNSIGPVLSRARRKLREKAGQQSVD
jgi:RNA polymerase sigma-70 factor, ECF subfamily